ncbi:MAG: glycosyltransferase [Candidatus Woesearchaeota archaeon]
MVLIDIVRFYDSVSTYLIELYISVNRPILSFINGVSNILFEIFLFLTIFISIFFLFISFVALFQGNKRSEYSFDKNNVPFVTIQIPTYNEVAALNCAERCLKMDYPKDKYQIIIGDDSNDPLVSAKIDAFAKKNDVLVTRRGKNIGFKPGNLNHMLKYTKGEIIVIFDSDFLPDKRFLKKIVSPFQHDESVGGVQARWKIYNAKKNKISILASAIILGFHHVYIPFMKNFGGVSFLNGSAEAVRKDLLVKNGGWLSGSLTEDIEYSIRLINSGYRIHYLEDYGCNGEVPFKADDLYKQQMRWAYGVTKSIISNSSSFIKNKSLSFKTKFLILFQGVGYLFSFLILALFFTGFVSFLSNEPAPIDFGLFFSDLSINILLTSGILFASFIGLAKSKLSKNTVKALFASLSYGLVVVFYVNIGVFKALTGRPMKWFMLKKLGNQKR